MKIDRMSHGAVIYQGHLEGVTHPAMKHRARGATSEQPTLLFDARSHLNGLLGDSHLDSSYGRRARRQWRQTRIWRLPVSWRFGVHVSHVGCLGRLIVGQLMALMRT